LGSGGWGDSRCDQCSEVAGEFTLEHDTVSLGHEFSCLFSYIVEDWCDDSYIENCPLNGHSGKISLHISLRIPHASPAANCTIAATVRIAQFTGQEANCTANCFAEYSGTFLKADFEGCFDKEFQPFTLARILDGCPTNSELSPICTGNLPTTITIAPA
jgi:hypothetical protein